MNFMQALDALRAGRCIGIRSKSWDEDGATKGDYWFWYKSAYGGELRHADQPEDTLTIFLSNIYATDWELVYCERKELH